MVRKTEIELNREADHCVRKLLAVLEKKYGNFDFETRLYALFNYSQAFRDFLVRVDNKDEMELVNAMVPLNLEIRHSKEIGQMTLELGKDDEFMCYDEEEKPIAGISMYVAVRKVIKLLQEHGGKIKLEIIHYSSPLKFRGYFLIPSAFR